MARDETATRCSVFHERLCLPVERRNDQVRIRSTPIQSSLLYFFLSSFLLCLCRDEAWKKSREAETRQFHVVGGKKKKRKEHYTFKFKHYKFKRKFLHETLNSERLFGTLPHGARCIVRFFYLLYPLDALESNILLRYNLSSGNSQCKWR